MLAENLQAGFVVRRFQAGAGPAREYLKDERGRYPSVASPKPPALSEFGRGLMVDDA
jgi:hypothetical protein